MTDIVAELRRKIGDRDGDDGVISVTFGEMRSLLDVVEATQAIARFRSQHALYMPEEADALNAELDRLEEIQRAALAALERSDDQ